MAANCRFKVDNPHFAYFLRGHPGLRLREDVEKKSGVKIEILNNADEVLINGDAGKIESVKSQLRTGWHMDDFQKAKEIFDLQDSSPDEEFFSVPAKHVSSLIGHYGRRVAGLENRSSASIKIDCVGHVSVFGTKDACQKAKMEVLQWIKQENGERLADIDDPKDDAYAAFGGGVGVGLMSGTPTMLTFWVPSRGAALIIGRHGQNVQEFEKQFRCMIDLRTSEESPDGMVPVDITAKEAKVAYKAKDEMLKFLDRFFPSRDCKETHEQPLPPSTIPHQNGVQEKPSTGAKGVTRLTFTVAEEHAPRLIGTRGINKKRLEEKTDCCLILRTEERRNSIFPVDVIGRNMEECERAKGRIQAFLNERPTTATPPKRGRQPPPLATSQLSRYRSRSEPEDSPEKSQSLTATVKGPPKREEIAGGEGDPQGKPPSPESQEEERCVVWERRSEQSSMEHSLCDALVGESSEAATRTRSESSKQTSDYLGFMPPHFQSCFGPLIPSAVESRSSKVREGGGEGMVAQYPIGTKTNGQRRLFVPDRLETRNVGDFLGNLGLSALEGEPGAVGSGFLSGLSLEGGEDPFGHDLRIPSIRDASPSIFEASPSSPVTALP